MSAEPLQYSTHAAASSAVPDPAFTVMNGSTCSSLQCCKNSSVPKSLGSVSPARTGVWLHSFFAQKTLRRKVTPFLTASDLLN